MVEYRELSIRLGMNLKFALFLFEKIIPCKARDNIYNAPIVFVGESFYLIGGAVDNYYVQSTNTIGRFNTQTRKWTQAGQLISKRFAHGAIFDGSSIIVIGGRYEQKTETCKISNGQVSCKEQSLSLMNCAFYPELYLVDENYCKTKP